MELIKKTNYILLIKNGKTNEFIVANKYEYGNLLKIIRSWTALTQEKFGKKFNMSRFTVCNFEKGRRDYNFNLIYEICKKFDFTMIIER